MARLMALVLLLCLAPSGLAQGNVYLASSFFRQHKYEKVLKILDSIEKPGPRMLFYKAESLAALDRLGHTGPDACGRLPRWPVQGRLLLLGSLLPAQSQVLHERKRRSALRGVQRDDRVDVE